MHRWRVAERGHSQRSARVAWNHVRRTVTPPLQPGEMVWGVGGLLLGIFDFSRSRGRAGRPPAPAAGAESGDRCPLGCPPRPRPVYRLYNYISNMRNIARGASDRGTELGGVGCEIIRDRDRGSGWGNGCMSRGYAARS